MRTTDFASLLSKYLLSYLPCQRGVSDNTLASYEAAFSRLLQYCEEERGLPVRKITVETLSPDLIEGYLNWLCEKQKNSASTRNQRLSAIKAFFKFTRRENPRYIYTCERILQIPTKKCPTPVLQYLSYEEIKEMLEKPNPCTEKGFRDLLILCLLYDTGARVSELLDLTVGDIHFGRYARVQLTGKGKKSREVPLSAKTADLLKSYIQRQNLSSPEKRTQQLILIHKENLLLVQGLPIFCRSMHLMAIKKSHHIFCGIQKLCTSSSLVSISSIYAIFWVMLILRRRKHMHVLTPR